jgi:hypothetical protein
MSTAMTKYDFDAKYGHLEFYDNRDRKHQLTYDCLSSAFGDHTFGNHIKSLSKTADDLGLSDLLEDYRTAAKYEGAYQVCVEKSNAAHKRVVTAKIKQVGKTKLKRSDFIAYQYSRDVDVDTVLDVCRMLDELVKRNAVLTANLREEPTPAGRYSVSDTIGTLTVRYFVGDITGMFSIPVDTWINTVRASNPAFHFLPFITN